MDLPNQGVKTTTTGATYLGCARQQSEMGGSLNKFQYIITPETEMDKIIVTLSAIEFLNGCYHLRVGFNSSCAQHRLYDCT